MKKFIYLLMAIGFVFTSCNPMEDIYADIDANLAKEGIVAKDFDYTLTEADYTDEIEDGGLGLNYPNFSSDDEAKELISSFLNAKYPYFGVAFKADGTIDEASSAIVTYALYNKINSYSAEIREVEYAEYSPITGNTYGNFDENSHLQDYLNQEYPDAEDDDFVSLRYDYYSDGVNSTVANGFVYQGDSIWMQISGFSEAEYEAMGESFPNFSSEDEAETKIPLALSTEDVEFGTVKPVMYELYSSGVTTSYTIAFMFNDVEWVEYNNVQSKRLQFGHDGTNWVPDNTITYVMGAADYAAVVSALEGTYPTQTASVGNYSNFDRRSGNAAYWSTDMLVEAVNVVLDNVAPSAEENQKYTVTFDIYNGSNTTENISVIKTGGVWVLQ
ncbi:hypothetical protein [Algibacter lectus]|uniref:hypothetical protein n=1 Tax=Algibacter lectus TaxID=221126 RepID=UPI0026ED5D49|nr:hypothetical protein [Algibacter lectus]MDO7136938.1 hypothetical protein [Algibacter lectus]